MYTFKILKDKKGQFRVQFCYKKEVMFWTETYTRKPSAKKAIESFVKNASTAKIEEVDESLKVLAKPVAKKPMAKKTVASKKTTAK